MFSEKERQIYQCPATQRFYDPLAVRRALILSGAGQLNEAIAAYNAPDSTAPERAQAEAVLVRCGRAAFALAAVDAKTGEGFPDATVIETVTAYTQWLRGKGPAAQTQRTSAPCSECPPSGS